MWAGDLDRPGGGRPPGPRAPYRPPPNRRARWMSRLTRSGCGSLRDTWRPPQRWPGRSTCSRHYRRHRSRSRPLALARRRKSQCHCRPRAVGRRILTCPSHPPRTVRPRHGRARAPAVRVQLPAGPGRAAGPQGHVEPGDRRPAVHQCAHGPVPLGQGLRHARHQLPQPASPHPACRPAHHPAALGPAGEPAPPAGQPAAWPTGP